MRISLKRKIKHDRQMYIEETVQDMEEALRRGDSKKLFTQVNKLSSSRDNKLINLEQGKTVAEKNRYLTVERTFWTAPEQRRTSRRRKKTLEELQLVEDLQDIDEEMAAQRKQSNKWEEEKRQEYVTYLPNCS